MDQKFVPGTKMKRTDRRRVTMRKSTQAMIARLVNNLRTYGSLMRDQFIKVYSLKPRMAIKTSSLYW